MPERRCRSQSVVPFAQKCEPKPFRVEVELSCCGCESYQCQFGEKHAAKDLKRYQRKGPRKTTRLLIDALKKEGVEAASLLDVGGGIGIVHHELLAAGASVALHVDATAANIRVAQEEARRRGHAGQVRFLEGDFVSLAPEVPPAEVVTLDRVICCYPDMEPLVATSASRARRLYGTVFPRDRLAVRLTVAIGNVVRRLSGNSFRSYVHPVRAIEVAVREQGLKPCTVRETFAWRVAVYSR